MTDTKMLRQLIDESGYKLRFIAEKCGLTYQGLLPKINGERDFDQTEIAALRTLLHLDQDQVDAIFFGLEVD